MSESFDSLIPEVLEIEDGELRRKVEAVWKEAMGHRDWSPADIREIPFTLLVDAVPVSFLEHVRTVCKLCIAAADILVESYGDRVRIHRDHLIAGALLADVGKLLEFEKKDGKIVKSRSGQLLRHPFSGVGLSYRHDLPEEVMHIIAVHSKEGDHVKRTTEALIFHHADFTDFDIFKYR
jgi:hypothetical protein